MGSAIALRPIHYASVSGGKDSLYMMKVILANPQKYPLDMVVNFDLEIEPPEAHVVADKIREMCERIKIPFWSIKPRRSFDELCYKWGMPTMMGRWCNSDYKMDCDAQLRKWIRERRALGINTDTDDDDERYSDTVKAVMDSMNSDLARHLEDKMDKEANEIITSADDNKETDDEF